MRTVWTRLGRLRLPLAAAAALVAALGLAIVASASHPEVSLPGSNFEIDTDANLKVDDAAPSIDWASVTETRKADQPSGATDDSFGQGTKEDTPVPTVVDGSIPPQKSDLLNFGGYLETVGTQSFLNLFWHRMQEPNGTTNMDFEFNRSTTLSGNGVTPVRTAGDVLVQYDLAQGGTNPQLFLSRWVTSGPGSQCEASNSTPCWGTRVNLTAAGDATGSINTTPIPAADSDGLGAMSARTFGEAQLDFDAITGGGCVGFGSAYLKSRSSDSFTAAVKDFIAPVPLNLNTCGAIEITKTRKHAAAQNPSSDPHAGVTFTITGPGLPAAGTTVVTDAQGKACLGGLQAGNYTVTETVPSGYHADGDTSKTVAVDSVGTCQSGAETVSFSNTPLTDISVSVNSQVDGGTASTINCVDGANNPVASGSTGANGDGSASATNLEPDTYTCTVVVDP
jgi:Prealbumin-like fold domain